jgi:hypothetical protein
MKELPNKNKEIIKMPKNMTPNKLETQADKEFDEMTIDIPKILADAEVAVEKIIENRKLAYNAKETQFYLISIARTLLDKGLSKMTQTEEIKQETPILAEAKAQMMAKEIMNNGALTGEISMAYFSSNPLKIDELMGNGCDSLAEGWAEWTYDKRAHANLYTLAKAVEYEKIERKTKKDIENLELTGAEVAKAIDPAEEVSIDELLPLLNVDGIMEEPELAAQELLNTLVERLAKSFSIEDIRKFMGKFSEQIEKQVENDHFWEMI